MASVWWTTSKVLGKGCIFAGVVYVTMKNGIWTSDTEKGITAVKSFYETVDKKLGGQYFTKLQMPTDLKIKEKWNYGVAKSFDSLANAPDAVQDQIKKGSTFVYQKFK